MIKTSYVLNFCRKCRDLRVFLGWNWEILESYWCKRFDKFQVWSRGFLSKMGNFFLNVDATLSLIGRETIIIWRTSWGQLVKLIPQWIYLSWKILLSLIFIFDWADEIDREQILNKNTVLQNISKAFLIIFFSRCGHQKVNLNCESYLFIQLWCAKSILQLNALTSWAERNEFH